MIPFIDLAAQQTRIKPRIDAAIQRVLAHGGYVMGPEVRAFEEQLATFGRAGHAPSCGNGTDALALPLMAWDIGPGDAVFFAQAGGYIHQVGLYIGHGRFVTTGAGGGDALATAPGHWPGLAPVQPGAASILSSCVYFLAMYFLMHYVFVFSRSGGRC